MINAIRVSLWSNQFIFGNVTAQYGQFRLHEYAFALRGGRLVTYPKLWIVMGEIAVPLVLSIREYSDIVVERQGPFSRCVSVGEIPAERSTPSGLYASVNKWLRHKKIEIDCYVEQVSAASEAARGNPHRAEIYRKRITRAETEYQMVNEAFHEFMNKYPTVATAGEHNLAKEEREARRYRKRIQRNLHLVNKALLK